MLRRFYTVMVVPHEGGSLRRVSVSLNFVVSMAGIFLFCFVSSAFLAQFFLGGLHRPDQSVLLRSEMERLNLDNTHLRSEVQDLAVKVDSMTALLEDFRRVKSNGKAEPDAQAMGGELVDGLFGSEAVEGDWRSTTQATSDKVDYWVQWLQEEICESNEVLESMPHGWPLLGRITSGCGWRRDPIKGGHQYHEGIDIAAPSGAPVRVTGDGVVVEAGRCGGYGNMVRVEHGINSEGKRLETLYAHLRRVHVREGEFVNKNDIVGEVGSTGRSTGPHLHYEVLENGRPVNPRSGYLH